MLKAKPAPSARNAVKVVVRAVAKVKAAAAATVVAVVLVKTHRAMKTGKKSPVNLVSHANRVKHVNPASRVASVHHAPSVLSVQNVVTVLSVLIAQCKNRPSVQSVRRTLRKPRQPLPLQ